MITYTRSVVSEPAFIMWVLLALIVVELCTRAKAHSWPLTLLLGAVTMLVLFTRTIGFSLVIAVFIRLVLLQSRRRALAHVIGTVAGATLFLALVLWLTPVTLDSIFPSQYLSSYQENEQLFIGTQQGTDAAQSGPLSRILRTTQLYAFEILRPTLLPVGGGEGELALGQELGIQDLPSMVSFVMTAVIVLGLLSFLWDKSLSPGVLLYILLYSGALAVWPWALPRLLYPLLPFLYFGLLWGTFQISRRVRRTSRLADNWFPRVTEAIVGLLFVVLLGTASYRSMKPFNSRLYFNDFEVGTDWLKENTPPETLVMGRYPQNIYFYSQRKAMDYTGVSTRANLERILSEFSIQYVMVSPCFTTIENLTVCDAYSRDVILPFLDEMVAAGEARLVYIASGKDDVRIFEILGSPPISASS
jgi:hypothetical protein